jgi:hypothetical protein
MQGAASTLRVIPAEKTAIVVLSNYDYNLPHAVADALMRVLLPKWNGMLADLQLKNLDSMEPLRGNWTGSIHTEDRDLPFRMRIENAGEIHVQISNNLRALLNVESWLDGNLKGEMYGDVGTEDAARRRYTIALDLDLHDDVLRGSATALSVPTQRNGSALPYYVELRRAQDQRPSAGTRQ